jgi:hypothetical protein
MSPQPTHSMRHHKHFVTASQTSSCRGCNKSQHLHLHPHVHRPYAMSSYTLFCHDSPLQSQGPLSGSAELWSLSGQGSDVGYHQLYLRDQYSAVEPKNQHRCHQKPAQHSSNKLPCQYISNNKFCTRYFYQPLYVYIYIYMCVCVCVYVLCKQAYGLCETKDTVTVENSELPCHVVKILKILRKSESSRCSNQISYQFQTMYKPHLVYTGLCQ